MRAKSNSSILLCAVALFATAAISSAEEKTLIDYFLPMPIQSPLVSNVWGAPGVLPRDPQNGLEDVTMTKSCYWDGQIIKGPEGKCHMFASRWDQERGHRGWSRSVAVHAVSDDVIGPYVDTGFCWPDDQGGKGHNVTALVLPDGRYAVVVSETRPGDVFVSKSLDGPWKLLGSIEVATNEFSSLGRMSNVSVMLRPDGDFMIVARSGAIWISKSGILGPYTIQGPGIYSTIPEMRSMRTLEDPVVWFSGGLYHIVVNDWNPRKAYHLTSSDGISNWTFRGLAYDPTTDFLRYADGTVNHWYKIERPGVLLENGHVTHFTFAVLDIPKDQEQGNDMHGSKVIVVPFDGAALDRDLQDLTGAADGDTEVPAVRSMNPIEKGPFQPTWESLQHYQAPDWFRDAKFGIWAHWGPQCQPEQGDWYARGMYQEGSRQYRYHVEHYGHPSEFGFKDVIHEWKAQKWDPDRLVALYKRVGAQYFLAMANHHDNLDLWDSKYQPWNSVNVGPRKNIIAGWAAAARRYDLPFGVSVHAAHAWLWYEPAQGADQQGDQAGVPFDGKLTAADGAGQWWDGFDPQDLYAQDHEPTRGFQKPSTIHSQWGWQNGASTPDAAYCEKFYRRTLDLIDKYQPDLVYFDDTGLPLWPVSDVGLRIAAHYYNTNMALHDGRLEAVLFGKILDETQRQCMVWDIERGQANEIEPYPWQTDTCIGGWHYDRSVYSQDRYKSAKTVIHMLADIVSKNGNLLLNIPVRGDGSIDEKEEAILEEIGAWMDINQESIIGTRPWRIFGEGPATSGVALSAQGFNEGKGKPFTAEDIRFTTKGETLFAIAMGWPEGGRLTVKSLGLANLPKAVVETVELLGIDGQLEFSRDAEGLTVTLPITPPCQYAYALKVCGTALR